MNFDLRQFEAFPAELSEEVEADSEEFELEGVTFHDLLNVKLTIHKVNEEYYCQGYASVMAEVECSRCLSLFDIELAGDLNFIVKPEGSPGVMASDSGGDIYYISRVGEPIVEITDSIRQALQLSLPLKPLCNENCLGLCPSCGINLNEESCNCQGKEIDERWEGLRDLQD
jgi:uncharacterized protein